MRKIVELKIEETKAVVGGTHVAAPPVATTVHAPIAIPTASTAGTSVSGRFDTLAALI
jgi:hypothetical protein